ncbi:cyclic nucleotide-binding domain-containing protein [Limnobacter humi]|uniref:Cyclic nucleotide-binding domain-containing protein n=1 Tax=Limnobacter humi TaxID=1778671 RepID=A0ABT1WFI7_9BURK|nr:cyclic nucleotide-binding domain-containing protein [Limnobacter humi]MCQ8896281.1 cyclic nucleotide-binding domain-containing protein [Limnobacter humi]
MRPTPNNSQTAKPMFAHLTADYDIAIVGSGPAGLSAASRAQELGCSYVLLEAENHASDTIYKYQKGKHVMAEPGFLPLRSGMSFEAGKREAILGTWDTQLAQQGIHIQYKKKVSTIQKLNGGEGPFALACEDGTQCTARTVILGIGLQGNIRTIGTAGDDLPNVQYTLNDPDEFQNETIVVIGAGDAAIENALGLMSKNTVLLVNRREEFARCKEGNLNLILAADSNDDLKILYNTSTVRIEEIAGATDNAPSLRYVYKGPDGERTQDVHRIIARLGATPPRQLVEGFGVQFPNSDPNAVPALSETYESNVPGLFIVGALGGYPLIKQAMNQGYEVVDTIMGLPVVPADEPLLADKFKSLGDRSVSEVLDLIAHNVPVFSGMTRLQLREFMLESAVLKPAKGQVVFKKNDYTSTFFSIVEGSVDIELVDKQGKPFTVNLGQGQYFGEMGLISGRRRTATVRAGAGCVLVETPRKAMLKLIASVDSVRKTIDEVFVRRAISMYLAPSLEATAVEKLLSGGIDVRRYAKGEVLFKDGDEADGLYLIRRGSVAISKVIAGKEMVLSYVSAGNYVGEMAMLNNNPRSATVTAAVMTEALVLPAGPVRTVLDENPQWRAALQLQVSKRVRSNIFREDQAYRDSDLVRFLMQEGLGEATDALIIDENLCIQCDNCETACADTHDGTSRLDRSAGPTFQNIHIPTSCRHCEHPHCMKDCPPDAIRRNEHGEVMINDSCIGCGNCQRNCPYGVIQMAVKAPPKKGNLLTWLLFGLGDKPGQRVGEYDPNAIKKAVKCDMCHGSSGGPACVRACPTGAAIRISPEQFLIKPSETA